MSRKRQQEQATGIETMLRETAVTLLLVVEGYAWLASGYSGFRIDWP